MKKKVLTQRLICILSFPNVYPFHGTGIYIMNTHLIKYNLRSPDIYTRVSTVYLNQYMCYIEKHIQNAQNTFRFDCLILVAANTFCRLQIVDCSSPYFFKELFFYDKTIFYLPINRLASCFNRYKKKGRIAILVVG